MSKINVLNFFDMDDFFLICLISRNTEILIELNYWLKIYVPYILKKMKKKFTLAFIKNYIFLWFLIKILWKNAFSESAWFRFGKFNGFEE